MCKAFLHYPEGIVVSCQAIMNKVVNISGSAAINQYQHTKDELPQIQQEMYDSIEHMDHYAWNKGKLGGLDWGIPSLNEAFDGLQPGLIMIAGQPNIGKSALCMQLGWAISQSNKEIKLPERPSKAYVIYFSLDDNTVDLLPRVIAIDQKISINAVKSPRKYEEDVVLMSKRNLGIKNLKNSVEHLKIIDSTEGSSIEFIEDQIRRHQMELAQINESYKIVVIIDNFHDITVSQIKFGSDGNAKYDYIASELSRICTHFDVPVICTGEFRKLNGTRRPTIDDVRETVKIAYEAKAILLCYNEVGIRGEAASIYWNKPDNPYKQPVLEVKVGKNKYTSFKNRIFFEFFPEMSYLKEATGPAAQRYNQMIIG